MNITDRFAELWVEWDERVRTIKDVPAYLAEAKDEDLIELLAGATGRERKYERDVVATEIMNRLGRRHNDLPAAAAQVLSSAEAAYDAAARGQKAIHTAESILKASGQTALGVDVSASAYASLDTTKLAFEAAQQNSADVQAVVSQSRVAHRLAEDAARTADRGSEATHDAARSLHESGHAEEAQAAYEAADEIAEAAQATVEAVEEERAQEITPEGRRAPPAP